MKIILNNIGKISDAEIELNGITVIAGENDTGKSTVNRALYAACNGFYHSKDQIERAREESIGEYLRRLRDFGRFGSIQAAGIARDMIADREKYSDSNALKDMLMQAVEQNQFGGINTGEAIPEEKWSRVLDGIMERLRIPDEVLFQNVIQDMFQTEFHEQIIRFGTDTGYVKLIADSGQPEIVFENNSVSEINHPCDFPSLAVFLDDPAALDAVYDARFAGKQEYGHHFHLMRLLNKKSENIVDEAVSENRLKKIYELISTACGGELIFTKYGRLGYRKRDGAPTVDVRNLSAGIKSFAMIKLLLLNHTLDDRGVILLDEPENNLHPAWQLLFAELLILIQKEFDMRVLLNTHSPYFLDAIETFSAKHAIQDKCKFYLSSADEDDAAHFEDVSNHTEMIYDKLAAPFQILENEECSLP